MKLISLLTITFLFLAVQPSSAVVMVGFGQSAAGPPTPDYQWNLEDNAASQTVVYTYGADASTSGSNTADITSTSSCFEGSRCFDFSLAASAQTRVNLSSFPAAMFTDDDLTVQVAFKIPTQTISTPVRLFNGTSNTVAAFLNSNNTTLRVLYRGNVMGNATIDDAATGSWQVIRVVFNAGTAKVYQGANEGALTLKQTLTATFGSVTSTGYLSFYGEAVDNQCFVYVDGVGDQIKVWDGAVEP